MEPLSRGPTAPEFPTGHHQAPIILKVVLYVVRPIFLFLNKICLYFEDNTLKDSIKNRLDKNTCFDYLNESDFLGTPQNDSRAKLYLILHAAAITVSGHMEELFNGAQFQLEAEMNDVFKDIAHRPLDGANQYLRTSSHASESYGLDIDGVGHLLYWTSENDNLHFQLERSSMSSWSEIIKHSFDYINYILSDYKQQGVLGESFHNDHNPIVLR